MTKKKNSKSRQCLGSSKWIKSNDGTYSLIVDTKKSIVIQKPSNSEVNNNEVN